MAAQDKQLKKFQYEKLPLIISKLELTGSTKKQLQNYQLITQQLDYLITKEQYDQAIRLLALGLPKQEVVWWSYLTVKQYDQAMNDIKAQNALQFIENWVREPTEEKRRLAEHSVAALTLFSPIAWVAQAIFMSGGSIAPIDQFQVMPDEFACAHCAATAMILVKAKSQIELTDIKRILRVGLHIAMGGNGKV